MIPTPIDLRRIERAKLAFGFDPRDIGGANHIRWWFATEEDAHYDADQQGERDCFVGDLVVIVRDAPLLDMRICQLSVFEKNNWVTSIRHKNHTTSYIFQPTSKLTKEEQANGED